MLLINGAKECRQLTKGNCQNAAVSVHGCMHELVGALPLPGAMYLSIESHVRLNYVSSEECTNIGVILHCLLAESIIICEARLGQDGSFS